MVPLPPMPRCPTARRRAACGFSLVELMIIATVVGILAAIAIPSYSAYIVRGQRAAAKAALSQVAQFMERNYTSAGCYNYADAASCQGQAGNAVLLPFANAPTDSNTYTYSITLAASAAQSYTVAATPCGESGSCPAGSNTSFDDPSCKVLSLTNAGVKAATGPQGNDNCWGR